MASGVYAITNTVSLKRYIGSSDNIDQRWRQHRRKLRKNGHSKPHLQAAWNKYGERTFRFEVLCLTDQPCQVEQAFLTVWKPEYNISVGADAWANLYCGASGQIGASRRGCVHSIEAKVKMSASHKGKNLSAETRAKISSANKGKVRSEEQRANISKSKKGKPSLFKGQTLFDETRAKISADKIGKPGHPHTEEHRASMYRDNNSSKRADVHAKINTAQKAAWARRKAAQGNANTLETKT